MIMSRAADPRTISFQGNMDPKATYLEIPGQQATVLSDCLPTFSLYRRAEESARLHQQCWLSVVAIGTVCSHENNRKPELLRTHLCNCDGLGVRTKPLMFLYVILSFHLACGGYCAVSCLQHEMPLRQSL